MYYRRLEFNRLRAGSDVIAVSRGRERDDVLPVRVQRHKEEVLQDRRCYRGQQLICIISSCSSRVLYDVLSQRLSRLCH